MYSNLLISLNNDKLVLEYTPRESIWLEELLNEDRGFPERISIRKIFFFEKEDFISLHNGVFKFHLGNDRNKQLSIGKEKLEITRDLTFIDVSEQIALSHFVSFSREDPISIFKVLDEFISKHESEISIGNNDSALIQWNDFIDFIDRLPRAYEIDLYKKSRIEQEVRRLAETKKDLTQQLNKYREKRKFLAPMADLNEFISNDIQKYEAVARTLKNMLEPKNIKGYTENWWQKQIIHILLLIFPQYIAYFEKVKIKDHLSSKGKREIDIILINATGNLDIIEIKRPEDKPILAKGKYRDNHVPARELIGTIMQVEKYVINLIKQGKAGEDDLQKKYSNNIPGGLKLQINSPKGIIIFGRDADLTKDSEKRDFEIIKRKYSNIIDIITYDDLIRRIDRVIDGLRQQQKNIITVT